MSVNLVHRTVIINNAVRAARMRKEEEAIEKVKATPEWKDLQELNVNREMGIVERPKDEGVPLLNCVIMLVFIIVIFSGLFISILREEYGS